MEVFLEYKKPGESSIFLPSPGVGLLSHLEHLSKMVGPLLCLVPIHPPVLLRLLEFVVHL